MAMRQNFALLILCSLNTLSSIYLHEIQTALGWLAALVLTIKIINMESKQTQL